MYVRMCHVQIWLIIPPHLHLRGNKNSGKKKFIFSLSLTFHSLVVIVTDEDVFADPHLFPASESIFRSRPCPAPWPAPRVSSGPWCWWWRPSLVRSDTRLSMVSSQTLYTEIITVANGKLQTSHQSIKHFIQHVCKPSASNLSKSTENV